MWPFRRRQEAAGPDVAGARDPGWAATAPIARTIEAPDATIGTTSFERDLASRKPPQPFLAPLAHNVSSEGPVGLISGLTAPVREQSQEASEKRTPRSIEFRSPVQRSVASGWSTAASDKAPHPASLAAPAPPSAPRRSPLTTADIAEPVVRLPIVREEPSSTPDPSAVPAMPPSATVQRAGERAALAAQADRDPIVGEAPILSQQAADTPRLQQDESTSRQEPTVPAAEGPSPAVNSTLGDRPPVPKIGLGAPLPGGTPPVPVQRSALPTRSSDRPARSTGLGEPNAQRIEVPTPPKPTAVSIISLSHRYSDRR